MIEWVDEMLRTWGRAKRRINGVPELRTKDNCLPSGRARSFTGRLSEGGHVVKDKDQIILVEPLEVFLGDALVVAVATKLALQDKSISEYQYELLYAHYVLRGSNRKKYKAFNMDRKDYFDALHTIHARLISWLYKVEKQHEKSLCVA